MADTCLKSCGLDIGKVFVLAGVPPNIVDMRFLGFNVPYPFNSSKLLPTIYKYVIKQAKEIVIITFSLNNNTKQWFSIDKCSSQVIIIIDG